MDQVISTTENSAIIPEIWSQRQYEVLLASLVFAPTMNNDYEGEIQDLGDTVNIFSLPEFSEAVELDELAANDADSSTASTQQLVINSRVAKDFIVTKKALLQSLPFMDGLKEKAVYSIMKKMELLIITDIVPSAAAPDHQIAYAAGTTLALADLLAAKELLDLQNVPESDRHGVFGSAQLNDIFNITGFTSRDFLMSGNPLITGKIPDQLVGFAPHTTTLVGNTSTLYHKSFMTLAVQQALNIELFNLGNEGKRAARVNVDLLFGRKQMDNKRVVEIA